MPDRYRRFKKIFYQARMEDEAGNPQSLWAEKWTLDDLAQMEADDPVGFAKEMQGDPSSGSLETIRREDFRYWEEKDNGIILYNDAGGILARWAWTECKAAIACDLAWENNKASDFSAIMPGLVTPNNDLLFCSYITRRGLRPDEFEEIIFSTSTRYEALTGKRVQVGFEKAKLEKVMKWFLQEAQRRRNKWLWLTDINWGGKDKVERVLSRLGNRYAQHSIYHRRGMGELENQLIRLRSVAHDDLADCAGMLPEMLSVASHKIKPKETENIFNFMRKQTPQWRNKHPQAYQFGQKGRPSIIPTKQGI